MGFLGRIKREIRVTPGTTAGATGRKFHRGRFQAQPEGEFPDSCLNQAPSLHGLDRQVRDSAERVPTCTEGQLAQTFPSLAHFLCLS